MALALAHRPHVGDLRARDQQQDPGVAGPERAQAGELLGDLLAEALAADHRIDPLAAHPRRRRQGCPPRLRTPPERSTRPASISSPAAARCPP